MNGWPGLEPLRRSPGFRAITGASLPLVGPAPAIYDDGFVKTLVGEFLGRGLFAGAMRSTIYSGSSAAAVGMAGVSKQQTFERRPIHPSKVGRSRPPSWLGPGSSGVVVVRNHNSFFDLCV
jgi:hypothetical protein